MLYGCRQLYFFIVDFDQTVVSIHTGGYWRYGSVRLIGYVRPCFRALLQAAVVQPNLYICIVTYSSQPALIKDVLNAILKKKYGQFIVLMLYFILLPSK